MCNECVRSIEASCRHACVELRWGGSEFCVGRRLRKPAASLNCEKLLFRRPFRLKVSGAQSDKVKGVDRRRVSSLLVLTPDT